MKTESGKFPIWGLLGFIVLALIAAWFAAGIGKSVTIRFKVIPQVEIGGKLYEGSTVMSAKWTRTDGSLMGYALRMDERGEAVVVDLGKRGILVVLPRTTELDGGFSEIYPDAVRQSFGIREYRDNLDVFFEKLRALEVGQRASFKYHSNMAAREFWPLMLTMDDFNNPATVREVTRENFSEVFGSDARLNKILLEITDEPVTKGKLVEKIPLLNNKKQKWSQMPEGVPLKDLPPPSERPFNWKINQSKFYTMGTWNNDN